MGYKEYSKKLDHIVWLAQRKMTGNPVALAEKLEVSERTVKRMIQSLKEDGVKIVYDRKQCTYILKESQQARPSSTNSNIRA